MPLLLTPRHARGGAGRLPGALRRDGGSIAIGRDPASDVPLEHPLVSGRHCAIVGSGAAWQLHDSSTNGTLLNGERVVGPRALRDGDVIGIADFELLVNVGGGGAVAGSAPVARQDAWGRGAAAPVATATTVPMEGAARTAIEGIAALSRARVKARQDLGVPVVADPLTEPGDVMERLAAMPPASAAGAVTKACEALAAHERAMLAAMQAAFRATLDHFAPAAIKLRAKSDAEAWKAYERAFGASSDGFVETFAQELAKAYRAGAG